MRSTTIENVRSSTLERVLYTPGVGDTLIPAIHTYGKKQADSLAVGCAKTVCLSATGSNSDRGMICLNNFLHMKIE